MSAVGTIDGGVLVRDGAVLLGCCCEDEPPPVLCTNCATCPVVVAVSVDVVWTFGSPSIIGSAHMQCTIGLKQFFSGFGTPVPNCNYSIIQGDTVPCNAPFSGSGTAVFAGMNAICGAPLYPAHIPNPGSGWHAKVGWQRFPLSSPTLFITGYFFKSMDACPMGAYQLLGFACGGFSSFAQCVNQTFTGGLLIA